MFVSLTSRRVSFGSTNGTSFIWDGAESCGDPVTTHGIYQNCLSLLLGLFDVDLIVLGVYNRTLQDPSLEKCSQTRTSIHGCVVQKQQVCATIWLC